MLGLCDYTHDPALQIRNVLLKSTRSNDLELEYIITLKTYNRIIQSERQQSTTHEARHNTNRQMHNTQ